MDLLQDLISNKKLFFSFMKEKYPVYKESNIFFRDLQYAIINYYMKKGKISSSEGMILYGRFSVKDMVSVKIYRSL